MKDYKVAIIGGGISGLYCAKKLRDHGIKRIVVLEKSGRWGGRLDTDMIKIDNSIIKEEKGAMRFTYRDPDGKQKSNMPLLSRLIKDMEMEADMEPFYMEPQPALNSSITEVKDCNSNFFGNRHFSSWHAQENPNIWSELFNLATPETNLSPSQIMEEVYQKLLHQNSEKVKRYFDSLGQGDVAEIILKQNDVEVLQEHQDVNYWAFFRNEFEWPVRSQMTKMREITMLSLLREMGYSNACCQMIAKTDFDGEDTLSRANAGSVLQYELNSDKLHDNLYQFKNGWSSLVGKITEQLEKGTDKVELLQNCEVASIEDIGDGFILELSSGDKNVKAEHVVMAIPPDAVKGLLEQYKPKSDLFETYGPVLNICSSTIGVDCIKFILYFERDWWNKHDNTVLFGPNSTDLSCGAVYPYYDQCRKNQENHIDDPSPAALTIYCGSNRAEFWRKYQQLGPSFESPLQGENSNLIPVSEALVEEALKQLKKIFNVEEIPYPILTSYRSWDSKVDGDRGYAYHYWGLGVDERTLEVTQPVEGKKLYLCSEAWSGYQGYVEGSLTSTEKVVDRIVGACRKEKSE